MTPRVSTSTLADGFLSAKRTAGLSPSTLQSYSYHLRRFAQHYPCLPEKPKAIEDFLASIPTARYRRNYYVTLRTFYRWHFRQGSIGGK